MVLNFELSYFLCSIKVMFHTITLEQLQILFKTYDDLNVGNAIGNM